MDDWPPHRPKQYTPLTIVHHEQMVTESEVKVVAQEMHAADVWINRHVHCSEIYNKAIQNINDIFMPYKNASHVSYMILIEGAPGKGKTELSKEIALQWTNNSILRKGEKVIVFIVYT